MENIQDFIIIGGGPAGSTIATQLVRKGYKVTVFEKEKFPREHGGESLLPFCYQMMEEMEILDSVLPMLQWRVNLHVMVVLVG